MSKEGKLFLLIIFAGHLGACRSDDSGASNSPESGAPVIAKEPTQDDAPLSKIPLESIGMVDPFLHREPPKDSWQGEVFNEQASTQLRSWA